MSWADDHGFLNKVDDSDTGLTLIGARDYDPTLGRFTSVDPVFSSENPLQDNGYAYADSNPITNDDPSGQCYNAATDALTTMGNCGKVGGAANLPEGSETYAPAPGTALPTGLSDDYGPDSAGSGGGNESPWSSMQNSADQVGPHSTPPSRQWYQFGSYSYHEEQWLGVGLNNYSSQQITTVFKDHPNKIFPFSIGVVTDL